MSQDTHTFPYMHTLCLPQSCTLSITNSSAVVQVAVSFEMLATNGLELRYPYGFELGCSTANGTMSQWMEGTAMKVDGDSVMVELPECPNGEKAATIRYCWRTDPCTFMKCPIYSGNLPAPPFIMNLD